MVPHDDQTTGSSCDDPKRPMGEHHTNAVKVAIKGGHIPDPKEKEADNG